MAKMVHYGQEFGSYDTAVTMNEIEHGGVEAVLSLAGEYDVALADGVYRFRAALPGTLDLAGIGVPYAKRIITWLSREHEYVGPAYYRRLVTIPPEWADKRVELSFDRCMWESRVFVDGVCAGSRDSLCTAHRYDLTGMLTPGDHTLVIRVDNTEREGASCHGYGNHEQIVWNGVLGALQLTARDPVYIESVRINPNPAAKTVSVRLTVCNWTVECDASLLVTIKERDSGIVVARQMGAARLTSGTHLIPLLLKFEGEIRLWDCFDPYLYELTAIISCKEGYGHSKSAAFGMRAFSADAHHFYLNGVRISLRGTHDGGGFSLTGHPSCAVEEWRRIARICKEHGLNHIRYHSFCPPEAAFIAADEEGVILQAELPYWGDVKNGWGGTAFLQNEMKRILDAYGNYASFCLFSLGNEHSGEWDVLADLVEYGKQYDNRHLYTAASNQYLRPDCDTVDRNPGDEYAVNMFCLLPADGSSRRRIRYSERYVDWGQPVEADEDYDQDLAGMELPVLSHELGHWYVTPNFDEREKYTGPIKFTALDLFRDRAAKQNLLHLNKDYHAACGKLAAMLYKEDIEKALRTGGLAGFQLLDIRDYTGQNAATVGMLDSFWESKGILEPAQFRRFCDHTVLLARISSFTWRTDGALSIPLEVYRYHRKSLPDAVPRWTARTADGTEICEGTLPPVTIANGGNTPVGVITLPTGCVKEATEICITATLDGKFPNSWSVWAYPPVDCGPMDKKVLCVNRLDDAVRRKLEKGGKVLFSAKDLLHTLPITFNTLMWTPTMSSKHCCGLLIDRLHPCLRHFPTQGHTTWQWEELTLRACGLPLGELAGRVSPVVQSIDQPLRAMHIAAVLELSVLGGTILITTLDIDSDLESRPAARQLRYSLLRYLAEDSESCDANRVSWEQLKALLESDRFSFEPPPADAEALLKVDFSALLEEDGTFPWDARFDRAMKNGMEYRVRSGYEDIAAIPLHADVSYRAGEMAAVQGIPCKLEIHSPAPRDCQLYLRFQCEADAEIAYQGSRFMHDYARNLQREWDDLRRGTLYTDNEGMTIGSMAGGKWVMVRIRREDFVGGVFTVTLDRDTFGYQYSAPLLTNMMVIGR